MTVDQIARRKYAELVDAERGLISRTIFSDPEIYRDELVQIFARCWLFLAHESQIPAAGDFVNVFMGEESVIVARHADGNVYAFLNSCRHRGNKVCRADAGNTKAFQCPYHGWTYNTKGELAGVPGYADLYHNELDRSAWGLVGVRVANYRGMLFGTFDPEAPTLEEFLGDMRFGLDLLLDQGEFTALPGIARWQMDVNWKFASDNGIGDMYHGFWSHRSAILAGHTSGTGSTPTPAPAPRALGGFTLVSAYGHGFNANFLEDRQVDLNNPVARWRRDPAIQAKLGPLRGRVNRANMLVFPNLFVNSGSREFMLRNPLGPAKMEIWKTTLVDKNADPDVQRAQARASNRHFGPAGMFEQDDGENWDQSTAAARGAVAQRYDLNYAMGIGHGRVVNDDQSPPRIDTLTNEHAQLWMYRCWAEYMSADSWSDLRAHHAEPEGTM